VEDIQRCLPPRVTETDVARLRQGYYTDAYFSNTIAILAELAREGYSHQGVSVGDIEVEMQFFPRRQPFTVLVGVEEAVHILRECAGFYDGHNEFVKAFHALEVAAARDGALVPYGGDPANVTPVLKVRGKYRYFGQLETPILGILTEGSRIATNVYQTLEAARGKDILFFPARFAHYKVQPLHGYAYKTAVDAYNRRHRTKTRVFVSTHAQGAYFGGRGGGTISHASIACFQGDTVETMLQFCRIMPPDVPRIALIDFHNDCVGEARKVLAAMFPLYLEAVLGGDEQRAARYRLFGVRPDTAGNMRDISVAETGDKEADLGVNPRLVGNIRQGLDTAYESWDIPEEHRHLAESYCRSVKIVVTGGFDVARIRRFEAEGVPVDMYGVGSSLLENSRGNTTDFTADIVRVKVDGVWQPLAKQGRQPNNNPELAVVT
jgi:nicotinate phosphoribosyltransferase